MNQFDPLQMEHHSAWYNSLADYRFHLGFSTVVNAELIIGKLSANCKGNGICKMLPADSMVAKCSAVRGTLVKRSPDRLDVVFYPRGCCPRVKSRVFASDTFLVEEPFQLPSWVKQTLSFYGERQIPAGSYPLLLLKECAFVSFKLRGDLTET